MPKQRGLPTTATMRHDQHFVEQLATRHTEAVGRKINMGELQPNPHQPRQSFGALDELVASIARVGVLEPLLVRELPGGYQIISGERRFRAAQAAGLREVPCIVLEVSDAQVLEIALIENLQRQDLSPFEEAEGLQALIDRFGYTHEEVAERISRARTSVTESLTLNLIPHSLRERLVEADVTTKSILLEIAREEDDGERQKLIELVVNKGVTRDQLRALRRPQAPAGRPSGPAPSKSPSPAPPRRLTYRSGHGITVTLYLSRPEVGIKEIQETLREAIAELNDLS